jgi:hypothetical protein
MFINAPQQFHRIRSGYQLYQTVIHGLGNRKAGLTKVIDPLA